MIHWNDISMRLVDLCLSWSSCIWQIYTSETLKQAEGVVSTVRCEGREHALGRGIKRKLDSIHSMHSTLHEDQDGQYCTVLLNINHIRVVGVIFPLSSKSVLWRNFRNVTDVTKEEKHGFWPMSTFLISLWNIYFLSFFVRMFFAVELDSEKREALIIAASAICSYWLSIIREKKTMPSRCSLSLDNYHIWMLLLRMLFKTAISSPPNRLVI